MTLFKSDSARYNLILFSPLIIIAIGRFTAQFAGRFLDVWAWLPLVIVLWIMFALFISWGDGWASLGGWLQAPTGGWGWSMLAVGVALIPLPLMILNIGLFDSIWLVIAWIVFAVINAPLEEFYWRGLLLDKLADWPSWLSVLFSSFFFALNHPLTLGVYSIANRHPATVATTFILGLVWAVTYRRTRSLRWVIAAHFLVDIFNLSVLAFLNVFVPPPIP